jgi:hypothetical protein
MPSQCEVDCAVDRALRMESDLQALAARAVPRAQWLARMQNAFILIAFGLALIIAWLH